MKKTKFSKKDQEVLTKSLSLFQNNRLKDIVDLSGAVAPGVGFSRSTWERVREPQEPVLS
ncbi:hypothetical protein [Flavobacterium sp. FlaQc-50]|jgi:hypothetical protein|uniref:hypothetical protein n=1 Tax=unclassified Flavobacterium TaxID=196869 RepID=UPI0037568CDB